MTLPRDTEAAVRDAYLEETEPKQRARDLAQLGVTIGPPAESHLPAHRTKPYTVIVSRGQCTAHHRFAQPEQARDLHRLLTARRDQERELAQDTADDRHHDHREEDHA